MRSTPHLRPVKLRAIFESTVVHASNFSHRAVFEMDRRTSIDEGILWVPIDTQWMYPSGEVEERFTVNLLVATIHFAFETEWPAYWFEPMPVEFR